MARRPGLLCGTIVLGVLLLLAVRFTCSRAKDVVAAARPPVRFFSAEAPVVDLYLGQLDQVERLRSVAEVSLVFFYAPWCAHSMAARQEVQQVAKRLAKQVQFVAVNCWWNHGKCRKQNRFYQYPTIHLFYRRFGPIEYKGPVVAPYVESFILRVITPLTYLPSRATLEEFLSYHEPRVVGFFQFDASPQPAGYITYLSSALQALKRDFRGVVRFGVVTNRRVAEAISLKEDEAVYLYRRFNSSLIFPRRERNFTSENICSWVFEHRETVLQWLQPPGTKSRLLEHELTKGPALLLFLPHNPLGGSAPLVTVADVAVRYHSCDDDNPPSSGLDASSSSRSPCCQSVLLPESSASVCEMCLSASSSSARCSFSSAAQGGDALRPFLRHCCLRRAAGRCSNLLNGYSPFSQYSACCKGKAEPRLDQSQAKEEPGSRGAPRTPPPPSSSTPPSSSAPRPAGDGIAGLRCRTNRTLRFYVLDAALNWPLAARLGAAGNGSRDAGARGDGSFTAIVNLKDEVHYVLRRSPAATLTESLEAFIRNFSAPYSLLQRHLVGEEDRRGGGGEEEEEEDKQRSHPHLLVTELTTASFLPSVMDLQKDVLLFYYTQWCGFCSVLNHVIIQLARLLQGNSTITVARVNVARNDLPWEFMVDHVPSILLFPKYRKHSSVKFPADLPITLPNLLHFILQHADQPAAAASGESGGGGGAVLRTEFLALQREVQALRRARERLSQQLAQMWRDDRRLAFEALGGSEAQSAELRGERRRVEERHRETSRRLGEAAGRLQELADASQSPAGENTLLGLLLRVLKDTTEAKGHPEVQRKEAEPKRSHMAS
uniref:Thioredoxin domain containing 11 n=1 Tax=Cyclopterus lumpus TaxID=8103 RepID=A0A8C2YXT1_CYCLU